MNYNEKTKPQKKALGVHVKVCHLRRRDFVCTLESCGKSFGYKHLLQRHIARHHTSHGDGEAAELGKTRPAGDSSKSSVIDILTGKAYKSRTTATTGSKQFICPYPFISFVDLECERSSTRDTAEIRTSANCNYAFSRAYDLRRHLLSEHGLAVEKGPVDRLVSQIRASSGRGGE